MLRCQRQPVIRVVMFLLVGWGAWSSALGAETTRGGPADQARRILAETGIRGGLIAHVHCGDGRLTAALGADAAFHVQGFDSDAATVAKARRYIREQGLYGRVNVLGFDGKRLPYAENMVNLLVAERPGEVSMAEMMRVLAPLGVAYVKTDDRWTKTIKPWPKEIDEWPCWLHGADGNAVARDTVAGPPRRLQWQAKPYWSRHHNTPPSVTDFVSAAGRVFYIVDDAPAGIDGSAPDEWALVGRDAFNGLLLWRQPIAHWGWRTWSTDWKCRFTVPTHITRRLVACGDRLYVTLGFNAPLTELDAATGRVLRTFQGSDRTDEILLYDGRLICALNKQDQRPDAAADERRGLSGTPPVRKSVAMFDIHSGKMLWKTGDYVGLRSKTGSMDRISHLSMCAGDGRVFFVDRDRIVALSLQDGRELWQAKRPVVPEYRMRYNIRLTDMTSLVYQAGVLYFAQLNPDRRVDWREVRGRLHAYSAETGKPLWNHQCASWGWGHPADVFVIDGLVWVHDFHNPYVLGLDPTTGQVKRQVSNFKAFDNGHHHRCYRNKATTRFLMTSYRGLEFIDWAGRDTDLNHWVRGTCRLGAFPCNGLIYATPHPCSCYLSSKLNGFIALAPAESAPCPPPAHPLVRGPAYDQTAVARSETSPDPRADWPMYRHDGRRSGISDQALPADLRPAWQVALGGKISACTVAGRTVLVAGDRQQVTALDAGSGRRRWSFTAGGRIDTPPTIDGGRAYFGCADGWLYCLRLDDGRLVWRFRGAPRERFIGVLDGIESAWPIHGSPLVENGVVHFTAGRSSFLDGGIGVFALDAATGRVIHQRVIASDRAMKVDAGTDRSTDSGLLSDLLVSDGRSMHMRQRRIDPPAPVPTSVALPTSADVLRTTSGMLNDEWFSRTRWYLGDIPIAEYFIYDDTTVYAVWAREGMSGYTGFITPGKGYELFAAERAAIMEVDPKKLKVVAKREENGLRFPKRWSIRLPVRTIAMALAGRTLFAAGWPDRIVPGDPWAAYEGRRGGKLLALSAADGQVMQRYDLDAPPVLDGLTVAEGRLFVCTQDGKVTCYQPKSNVRPPQSDTGSSE